MRNLLLLPGLLFLLACDNAEESSTPAAIRGRVFDAEGHALAHVGVVVSYTVPYPSAAGDTLIANVATAPPAPIWYSIPVTQQVVITVHEKESQAVVDTLLNTLAPAGWSQTEWDLRDREGRLVAADVYLVKLKTPTNQFGFDLLVNPDYPSASPPCRVLATTAANGSFAIPESALAFRHEAAFDLLSASGWRIGSWELERRVRVHVLDGNGCLATSEVLWVDPATGVEVELQVE